jgi:hypothetical protein
MFGSKPKQPKQPDPNEVSQAQTLSNQQTAGYNAALNRQNTYTPYGSQTFTQNGTDPATGAPRWDERITLAPDVQASFDAQMSQNRQLNEQAGGMMDRIRSSYSSPMDTSGVPSLRDAPNMGQYQTGYNTNGLPALQSGPSRGIDTSNLPRLYGAQDLDAARLQTQDALYNRSAGYLDPQWKQRENAFRSRMAGQGVVEGSEAWRSAMDDENRARAFEYGQARNDAIAGGGSEMQRLAGIASGNRSQMFGEQATLSDESFRNAQLNNDARAQGVGEAASMADFYNAGTGANNADALRAAGFGNQARAQGMDEAYRSRAQPLNEFNALRGSAPIEVPQFNPPPATSIAPTNTADNTWRGYQGQMDMYNAGMSGNNNMMGGIANLAGQLGSAWIMRSDKRLKKNIKKAGKLPDGTNIYDYTMKDTGERQRGVMAQEVERRDPGAVLTGADGYKRVDYGRVLARAMAA